MGAALSTRSGTVLGALPADSDLDFFQHIRDEVNNLVQEATAASTASTRRASLYDSPSMGEALAGGLLVFADGTVRTVPMRNPVYHLKLRTSKTATTIGTVTMSPEDL